MKDDAAIVLELVHEDKISRLLKLRKGKRYEASGVHFKDGHLHIIFDNLPHVMLLRPDWPSATARPTLVELMGEGKGYEDITYHPQTKRWYCLIEAVKKSGDCTPAVDEFDESFGFVENHELGFQIEDDNKGFEGLSTLCCAGHNYLLGLCEGNYAKGGRIEGKKGQGCIQVFDLEDGCWPWLGTIKVPEEARFEDYSSLDFHRGYMTVLSQKTSKMWIGRVRPDLTSLKDLLENPFEDGGQLFRFPCDTKHGDNGHRVYGNLEGVAWLSDGQVAVVSDKKKSDQPGYCADKDQSIHIFKVPNGCQART